MKLYIFTLVLIAFVFPIQLYAEADINIEVLNRDEFYAVQYMCISDAVSCAFDISEKVNPDKEDEVEKAQTNCCLKLSYCVALVDAIHPTVHNFEDNTESKDPNYKNNIATTYQTSCVQSSGTEEALHLPAANPPRKKLDTF